ncbi:hypothetical protein BpHYR1_034683 [Brachionus plicatilis]|uniref:Uncharacterized protein n=1 Tax=Brachionus plicatilis TaxID=10195 RepID=A0A3M7SH27_BRAPC|nr:hypothetical protein BpHYR1_034683 [Brachionus plicatilis]
MASRPRTLVFGESGLDRASRRWAIRPVLAIVMQMNWLLIESSAMAIRSCCSGTVALGLDSIYFDPFKNFSNFSSNDKNFLHFAERFWLGEGPGQSVISNDVREVVFTFIHYTLNPIEN